MDPKIKHRLEARAKIIKAMAHPSRLFIVDQLARSAYCVCELQEMIGDDMSTISKHLSVLKNAGIIKDEKKGAQVYYSLRVPCAIKFFDCVEDVIKRNIEEQKMIAQ